MQTRLNPYISFRGDAREALEFYQAAFGGKLEMTTLEEGGSPHEPNEADWLMHGILTADNGMVLMCSDAPMSMAFEKGSRISVSLSGDNEKEITEYYEKLSAGGKIEEPLKKAPWGDTFGMFTDKFGIFWLVNITGKTE